MSVTDLPLRLQGRIDATGDCWLWTGRISPETGYGRTGVKWAHRVVYGILVGPIPSGLTLDHLCRVRACVNPDHLEPVTLRENTRRGLAPSAVNGRKTHCVRGHELAGDNLYRVPRLGTRQCVTCRKARDGARIRSTTRKMLADAADALEAVG